ncbi:MAG: GIY-YIG nuclease family protein, partial [Chitinophagales bacterium]
MIELNMEQIQGVLSITRKNKRNGGLSDVLINLVGNCSCASGVYCIEHKSGKRYIGSSVDIGKRWRSHMNLLNQGNHYSKSLQKDWDEFGAENFKFCIIEIVNDEKNLIDREQCWIDKYESYNKNKGYNSSPSALNCSGVRHTEETKRKWSEIHKGRVFSEEHKRKIGLANKGKKRTPEMIERHRQKLLGRKTPEEIKKKISEACKGRDGFKL